MKLRTVSHSPPRPLAGSPGRAFVEASLSPQYLASKGQQETPIRPAIFGRLETMIGTDDRERVLDTHLPPWRHICALTISAPNGQFIGTGWFANNHTLITAGHCVFHQTLMGGWATSVIVSPGRNGSALPFGSVTARRFSALTLWTQNSNPDFDIGAIHLDEPVGDTTGWFGVAALPPEDLVTSFVNISGYPADRGRGTEQYLHTNRVQQVTGRRMFYDVDTYGGQSGSPVWIYQTGNSDPIVVGVHAYGVSGTPPDFGITANSGPHITSDVLEQIKEWLQPKRPGGRRNVRTMPSPGPSSCRAGARYITTPPSATR